MTNLEKIVQEMREASRRLGQLLQAVEHDYWQTEDTTQLQAIRGQVDNWHGQLKDLAGGVPVLGDRTAVYFNGENGECWGAINFGSQYRIGPALAEAGLLIVEQIRGQNFYLYHGAMSYAWDECHWWGPDTSITDRLLPQFGGTKDGELLYPKWLKEQDQHASA
jgi:hypothetical protein